MTLTCLERSRISVKSLMLLKVAFVMTQIDNMIQLFFHNVKPPSWAKFIIHQLCMSHLHFPIHSIFDCWTLSNCGQLDIYGPICHGCSIANVLGLGLIFINLKHSFARSILYCGWIKSVTIVHVLTIKNHTWKVTNVFLLQ